MRYPPRFAEIRRAFERQTADGNHHRVAFRGLEPEEGLAGARGHVHFHARLAGLRQFPGRSGAARPRNSERPDRKSVLGRVERNRVRIRAGLLHNSALDGTRLDGAGDARKQNGE